MNSSQGLTTDLIIQYSIVGAILLGVCVWMFLKIFRKNKKVTNSCCGCAIAGSCQKVNREKELSTSKKRRNVKMKKFLLTNRGWHGNNKDL